MKRTTSLYAVTAFAALSIAGQAFAKGGSMGGGQGHVGPQNMKQGGSGSSISQHQGQRHGSSTGPATKHRPVTTVTD